MHINATLVQDRFELAQVLEATQDGPWNDPPCDPLTLERLERASRVCYWEALRLCEDLRLAWEDYRFARISECDPRPALEQNLAYALVEHHGVSAGLAWEVVRETA